MQLAAPTPANEESVFINLTAHMLNSNKRCQYIKPEPTEKDIHQFDTTYTAYRNTRKHRNTAGRTQQ